MEVDVVLRAWQTMLDGAVLAVEHMALHSTCGRLNHCKLHLLSATVVLDALHYVVHRLLNAQCYRCTVPMSTRSQAYWHFNTCVQVPPCLQAYLH